jgi:hypothetical protein
VCEALLEGGDFAEPDVVARLCQAGFGVGGHLLKATELGGVDSEEASAGAGFSEPIFLGGCRRRSPGDGSERWHTEFRGCGLPAERGVNLSQLVFDAAVADLESLDLTEPAFSFRLDDSVLEVVVDLFQPGALRRVRP